MLRRASPRSWRGSAATMSSRPLPSLLLGMEVDEHLAEVLAVALRRRRQRAGSLHGAHHRLVVGLVARAAHQLYARDCPVGCDLEAHGGHQAGPAYGVGPVALDEAEDALAVGEELEAHDRATATRCIGAVADGPLLVGCAIHPAHAAGHAAAPALGGRRIVVVRRRL